MVGKICLVGLFFIPILSFGVYGQTVSPPATTVHQQHLWLQGFSTIKLRPRWELMSEIQIRRGDLGGDWQVLLLRFGPMYEINRNLSVGGGYAYIDTWPYGKQPVAVKFPEHRIWQQALVKHRIKKVGVDHRLRLEQRYLRAIDSGNRRLLDHYIFSNRVRYRGGVQVPVKRRDESRPALGKGDTFLYANSEIFFNFGKNVLSNVFDQNRAAAGVGHYFSKSGLVQMGYLHQYIQKGDGIRYESNHTLTLAFTYNFSLF